MQAPFPSLDLHVLSVPPAFILSQDQTLNLIRSLLLGFELTGIFITVPFILFSLDKVFSSQMLHCSIFNVHRFQFLKNQTCLILAEVARDLFPSSA